MADPEDVAASSAEDDQAFDHTPQRAVPVGLLTACSALAAATAVLLRLAPVMLWDGPVPSSSTAGQAQ